MSPEKMLLEMLTINYMSRWWRKGFFPESRLFFARPKKIQNPVCPTPRAKVAPHRRDRLLMALARITGADIVLYSRLISPDPLIHKSKDSIDIVFVFFLWFYLQLRKDCDDSLVLLLLVEGLCGPTT